MKIFINKLTQKPYIVIGKRKIRVQLDINSKTPFITVNKKKIDISKSLTTDQLKMIKLILTPKPKEGKPSKTFVKPPKPKTIAYKANKNLNAEPKDYNAEQKVSVAKANRSKPEISSNSLNAQIKARNALRKQVAYDEEDRLNDLKGTKEYQHSKDVKLSNLEKENAKLLKQKNDEIKEDKKKTKQLIDQRFNDVQNAIKDAEKRLAKTTAKKVNNSVTMADVNAEVNKALHADDALNELKSIAKHAKREYYARAKKQQEEEDKNARYVFDKDVEEQIDDKLDKLDELEREHDRQQQYTNSSPDEELDEDEKEEDRLYHIEAMKKLKEDEEKERLALKPKPKPKPKKPTKSFGPKLYLPEPQKPIEIPEDASLDVSGDNVYPQPTVTTTQHPNETIITTTTSIKHPKYAATPPSQQINDEKNKYEEEQAAIKKHEDDSWYAYFLQNRNNILKPSQLNKKFERSHAIKLAKEFEEKGKEKEILQQQKDSEFTKQRDELENDKQAINEALSDYNNLREANVHSDVKPAAVSELANFARNYKTIFNKLYTTYGVAPRKKGSKRTNPDILNEGLAIINKLQSGQGKSIDDVGLSNVQIDKMMKKYPEYLGTISHDEIQSRILPKIQPQSKGCFIINTDPHNKAGEHWQSIYFDGTKDHEIDFYDSFGDPADKTILKGVKDIALKLGTNGYLKYKDNKIKKQNDKSSNCGFFCVKFCIDRLNGKPFSQASGFDDHVKGEKNIEEFKKQHGYGAFKYVSSFLKKGYNVAKEAINRVKTAFIGRVGAPPAVRNLLAKHGAEKIKSIDVARVPVNSVITNILNIISLGQLEQNKQMLNYDQIYHLYLIIGLESGHKFKIERNESVNVSDTILGPDAEVMGVPFDKDITLNQFISNGSEGKPNFWQYDPISNNCQMFVRDLLAGSGLYNDYLARFVMQDADKLLANSPLTRKIASTITDIGSKLHILIHGVGKRHIQSVIFDKDVFSPPGAINYLRKHGLKSHFKPMHETEHFYRYRQTNPKPHDKYITKKVAHGVEYIIASHK